MSSDTSQRRLARSGPCTSGLPFAIWQSDQNSPVIPLTPGFAAGNACGAAARGADLMNNRAADHAMFNSRLRFLLRPVPFVAPGCSELTAMLRALRRRDSSLAKRAFANLDCP